MSLNRRDHEIMVRKEFQATRGTVVVQDWDAPDATDDDGILDDQATSSSVVTTVTEFLAQPDFPRNLTITPGGTTASVPAGNVTVTGTNIRDEVITETFAFLANATDPTVGAKAFKTITSIAFPVQDGADATYDVGWGDKLGLQRTMPGANTVLMAAVDGAYETTRPTVAADADEVEKNTIDTNTALNGAKDVLAVYVSKEITANPSVTA